MSIGNLEACGTKQRCTRSAGPVARSMKGASKPVRNRQRGFSLIELLIVVAIILVIAAIAIPNLLRSRLAANEASSVASLRSLNTAEIVYSTAYGSFSPNLVDLGPHGTTCSSTVVPTATAACLVDAALGQDPVVKSGYTLTYAAGANNATYSITAIPITLGVTGQRAFCTDQAVVIDVNSAGAACVPGTDPPL
jgi:type IV pilus assembly protein PilA